MAKTGSLLEQAYQLLGSATPLPVDCGELCNRRCCRGEEVGMLLLPGEEELLGSQPGFRYVHEDEETILVCSGTCERQKRPWACRIFPFFTLITARESASAAINIIYDPRAYPICPLAAGNYPQRGIFRYLLRRSTRLLLRDRQLQAWFEQQSLLLEALEDIRINLLT